MANIQIRYRFDKKEMHPMYNRMKKLLNSIKTMQQTKIIEIYMTTQ